ncbi:hypothetical protein M885DRAFT_509859 [Pelagophyceae sp. CCMP2097]|nr:hypothetical protein M885DRAFT_509859 [Pelagophyceae sp. CCMP2097]
MGGQRHTKNNGSSTYGVFSHAERKKCGFMNNLEMRAGVDSQLPFGWCSLSLQPAVDPVVTPSGHVYSRECLLEHMVAKTAQLRTQREDWEAQQRNAVNDARKSELEREAQLRLEFERANDPRINNEATKKRSREEVLEDERAAIISEITAPMATTAMVARTKEELKRTSFWLPEFTPGHAAEPVRAPEKRPPSPVTGQPLRSKDLVPIRLDASTVAKADGSKEHDTKYLCHVSRNEITTQPVVLIRSTGCVVLEDVAKKLGVFETKVCPITSRPFKAKDVVKLEQGISAYSACGGEKLKIKKQRALGGGA